MTFVFRFVRALTRDLSHFFVIFPGIFFLKWKWSISRCAFSNARKEFRDHLRFSTCHRCSVLRVSIVTVLRFWLEDSRQAVVFRCLSMGCRLCIPAVLNQFSLSLGDYITIFISRVSCSALPTWKHLWNAFRWLLLIYFLPAEWNPVVSGEGYARRNDSAGLLSSEFDRVLVWKQPWLLDIRFPWRTTSDSLVSSDWEKYVSLKRGFIQRHVSTGGHWCMRYFTYNDV